MQLLTLNYCALWKALGWMVTLSPRHIFRRGHKDHVSSVVRGMELLVYSRICSCFLGQENRTVNTPHRDTALVWTSPCQGCMGWTPFLQSRIGVQLQTCFSVKTYTVSSGEVYLQGFGFFAAKRWGGFPASWGRSLTAVGINEQVTRVSCKVIQR